MGLGNTCSSAQGLILVLSSVITHGSAPGIIYDVGDQTWLAICKASTLPTVLLLQDRKQSSLREQRESSPQLHPKLTTPITPVSGNAHSGNTSLYVIPHLICYFISLYSFPCAPHPHDTGAPFLLRVIILLLLPLSSVLLLIEKICLVLGWHAGLWTNTLYAYLEVLWLNM